MIVFLMKRLLNIHPFIFLSLFFLLAHLTTVGQTNDFGIWTGMEAKKKLSKRFDWSVEMAYRQRDNLNQRDETFVATEIRYSKKIFSAGLQYRLSDKKKKGYTAASHRFGGKVEVEPEFNRFKLGYRGQLQAQYTGVNSTKNGHIPESYFRNRFKIEYNIKGLPLNPSLSYELFYRINPYATQQVEKNRYTLGVDYKINKHNTLGIAFLRDETIHVKNPEKQYIEGID